MAASATPRPSLILPRASSHSHSQPSAVGLSSDRVAASRRRRGDFVFVVNPSGTLPHPYPLFPSVPASTLANLRAKRRSLRGYSAAQAPMAARESSGSSCCRSSAPASPISAT